MAKRKQPRRRRPAAPAKAAGESEQQLGAARRPTAQQQRDIAASWVRFHEEAYEARDWTKYIETGLDPSEARAIGNPLHVWSAYLECRGAGLPLPEWVLGYLDRVASRLRRRVTYTEGTGVPASPTEPAAAIASDMEMTRHGAGSVFEQYDHQEDLLIAAAVQQRITQGLRTTEAIQGVADERKKGQSTVERAWKKYKGTFE